MNVVLQAGANITSVIEALHIEPRGTQVLVYHSRNMHPSIVHLIWKYVINQSEIMHLGDGVAAGVTSQARGYIQTLYDEKRLRWDGKMLVLALDSDMVEAVAYGEERRRG